jgi:hypothetical protein
MVAQQEAQLMM